jgi:hypothetical protein
MILDFYADPDLPEAAHALLRDEVNLRALHEDVASDGEAERPIKTGNTFLGRSPGTGRIGLLIHRRATTPPLRRP